jgi:hypothetical protein
LIVHGKLLFAIDPVGRPRYLFANEQPIVRAGKQ